MKIEGSSVEQRDQGKSGGEGKGNYWGMILAQLNCSVVYMYEYVTVNHPIMYSSNAPRKE